MCVVRVLAQAHAWRLEDSSQESVLSLHQDFGDKIAGIFTIEPSHQPCFGSYLGPTTITHTLYPRYGIQFQGRTLTTLGSLVLKCFLLTACHFPSCLCSHVEWPLIPLLCSQRVPFPPLNSLSNYIQTQSQLSKHTPLVFATDSTALTLNCEELDPRLPMC